MNSSFFKSNTFKDFCILVLFKAPGIICFFRRPFLNNYINDKKLGGALKLKY